MTQFLAPPERAVVLCVDEKSQIHVLDRSQRLIPVHWALLYRIVDAIFWLSKRRTQCSNVQDDINVHLIMNNYVT